MNVITPEPQQIHCQTYGEGPRKMLALHCTIAHGGAWRGVARAMSNELSLIAPDMLSHGRSPDWNKQGDFPDRCFEGIKPLLVEPMDVIGHSFGATVALRLAVEQPELVRSLTLIEPVLFAVAIIDDPAMVARHNEEAKPFVEALTAGDDALAARLFNRMWGTVDSLRWPDLPEQTRAAMTRGIHVVAACNTAVFDDRAGILQPGVLDRVTMPTLMLRGDQTHPIIAVVNNGLVRRMPNAENCMVAGAGHMLPVTHSPDTADHLRRFLDKVPT